MRKSKAFLGLTAVIIIFSGAYIYACHSSHFHVSEIKIRGNNRVSAEEITEKLKACPDENIFRLDLDQVENKLKEDIRLKEVRVERRLPGCILVEVEEKTPVLWVSLPVRPTDSDHGGFYGLSIDQEIIPLNQKDLTDDLPIVSGVQINKGEPGSNPMPEPYHRWPNPKVERALEFYRCVTRIDPASPELLAELNVDDALNVTLYLLPGTRVMMGHGDFEQKWRRARTVLSGEERAGELARLDLRFDDQVVLVGSSKGSPSGRR
ncbi:MAG: FtsQ-type POTRA domain-containing protein [Candidatus Zixiibacteriota bacterium]